MVDLGLAAKIRPCLILSVPIEESDRSLVTLIPHTTSLRQSRFEVAVPSKFLRPGAFDAQGIVTVPTARLMNRLGALSTEQIRAVEQRAQIAERMGTQAPAIARLERALATGRHSPSIATVRKYVKACGKRLVLRVA